MLMSEKLNVEHDVNEKTKKYQKNKFSKKERNLMAKKELVVNLQGMGFDNASIVRILNIKRSATQTKKS